MHEQMKNRFVTASFEGVPAIFVERPVIVYVNVSNVISDDWGVKCTITDSCLPGMPRLQRSSCQIAAAWEVLDCSDGDWRARYVPWQMFFDPQVIKECLARADERAKAGKVFEWDDRQKIFAEYYARVSEELEKRVNAVRARGIRVS